MLITKKEELRRFSAENRHWQGIPGIEITGQGRLFVTFYSGGMTEEPGNFCVLITSGDGGMTWSGPVAAVYRGENFRCYDPCLWMDPLGRLWFIWSVAPEFGVWAAVCDNPDEENLKWAPPVRIGQDVMLNKPIVLTGGEWLFPIAVWRKGVEAVPGLVSTEKERLSFVYRSTDCGRTFERLGGADVQGRSFDEHMLLEQRDGSLRMFVRTDGIGQSFSYDGGKTWSEGSDTGFGGPCSRFHIRRLRSGNLLLINHFNYSGRNNLTAMVSEDEGKSWKGRLLLDERANVSYPDAILSKDGYIYVVYDRERGAASGGIPKEACAREILMAKITEEDICAGRLINTKSRLKQIVSRLGHGEEPDD